MLPIDPAAVGLPMAFTLGLVFGAGPCLIACLPFLGPVFLASDEGPRGSWKVLLPLSLGRLTAYGGLGLAAGWAGRVAAAEVAPAYLNALLGVAALMVGLALLLRRRAACAATRTPPSAQPLERFERRTLMPGGLYLTGVAMALSPCAPLGLVVLAAALGASPLGGLVLGLAFGCGALLVPTLAYGYGVAHVGSGLRRHLGAWRPRVELLAAGLMLASGLSNLLRLV